MNVLCANLFLFLTLLPCCDVIWHWVSSSHGSQTDMLHSRISEDVVTLATMAMWKRIKVLLCSSCEFLPSDLSTADIEAPESLVPGGIAGSHRSWKHLKIDEHLFNHNTLIRKVLFFLWSCHSFHYVVVTMWIETRLGLHYVSQRSWQWHDQQQLLWRKAILFK